MESNQKKIEAEEYGQTRPSISSIEELFTLERLPKIWWKNAMFFAYTPFGLILLLFRVIFGFHVFLVACILRKSMVLRCTVLRIMCTLLGIFVVQDSNNFRDKNCPLIIANHISSLDHMAVDLVEPCILPSVWDIPNLLRWCLGYADFGARQGGRQDLIVQARQFCQSSIEIASLSVLAGSWWQDTLWFLFVPFTVFNLKWLPSMKKEVGETSEDFCSRVALSMSTHGNLALTNYDSQEVVEAAKRHLTELERLKKLVAAPKSVRRNISSQDLDTMAMRVKETFPSVSLHAIRSDLDLTKSVEITSNNILAGIFNQNKSVPKFLGAVKPSNAISWRKNFNCEKWTLIEVNRLKYMKRKGIDL